MRATESGRLLPEVRTAGRRLEQCGQGREQAPDGRDAHDAARGVERFDDPAHVGDVRAHDDRAAGCRGGDDIVAPAGREGAADEHDIRGLTRAREQAHLVDLCGAPHKSNSGTGGRRKRSQRRNSPARLPR